MSFLCGINGSASVVLNYTGEMCGVSSMNGTDINLPSITVARLEQTRTVERRVTNVANNETYTVGWSAPYGVSLSVAPTHFFIACGETQNLTVTLNATMNSSAASFGRIGLFGRGGHILNIPVAVIFKASYNITNR